MVAWWRRNRFFEGLSSENGTSPGLALMNDFFELTFLGISDDSRQRVFGIAIPPDRWEQVMEMIFNCLAYWTGLEKDFEKDCEISITAWLREFEGWSLMFTLLPRNVRKELVFLYYSWNMENSNANVVINSNLELFEGLLERYATQCQGRPLSDLVARVEVKLHNILGAGKSGLTVNERTKLLRVQFLSEHVTLIVNFTVEKKRLRRTLVEHAAEVVACRVLDLDQLEIPETLKTVVSDKIIDWDWVSSHWIAKYEHKFGKEENSDIKPVTRVPLMKWFLESFILKPFYAIPRALSHLFSFSLSFIWK